MVPQTEIPGLYVTVVVWSHGCIVVRCRSAAWCTGYCTAVCCGAWHRSRMHSAYVQTFTPHCTVAYFGGQLMPPPICLNAKKLNKKAFFEPKIKK